MQSTGFIGVDLARLSLFCFSLSGDLEVTGEGQTGVRMTTVDLFNVDVMVDGTVSAAV